MKVEEKIQGKYGVKEMYVGVKKVIGENGVERIIEIDIEKEEKEKLEKQVE